MKIVGRVLAFVLLTCLSLSAQQITGNIRGTVTDPTGAVVVGAVVTAQQTETGLSRMATTDRKGNYVLLELPVGHYRLQVVARSFQEYVQDGITLNVNETASVSPRPITDNFQNVLLAFWGTSTCLRVLIVDLPTCRIQYIYIVFVFLKVDLSYDVYT